MVTSHHAKHSLRQNFANYSKRRKKAAKIFERTNEIQAFKSAPKNFVTNKKEARLFDTDSEKFNLHDWIAIYHSEF